MEGFQLFLTNLARAKAEYPDPPTPLEQYLKQKRQMQTLVALEGEFRRALCAHSRGTWVYQRFVKYICEERRNILDARPYFRHRQEFFTEEISRALKKRNDKALQRFHVNFQFIRFVMRLRAWKHGSPISRIYRKIDALRAELVETNMPLALNRARIFGKSTPPSHLAHMDLVQIAAEGLTTAVDKYCLPFSASFRDVIIGRIVGNLIEAYSETLIHFYPTDKRKLYLALKFACKHVGGVDFERLAKQVNEWVRGAYSTTAPELADLMAAASCVSADTGTVMGNDGGGDGALAASVPKLIDRFAAPDDTRPDVRVEARQALTVMQGVIHREGVLTLREQKLLRLRGVAFLSEAVL
jgi:hypothetical protein